MYVNHTNYLLMQKITLFVLFVLAWAVLPAQYEAVLFDYELGYFNNGQPLPAGEMLLFSGEIGEDIQAVEVAVAKPNRSQVLYAGLWQRAAKHGGENFRLPMNYKLQGNQAYDIRLTYYRVLRASERNDLATAILDNLGFYVQQQIRTKNGKATLESSASKLYKGLNQILTEQLSRYRPAQEGLSIELSSMLKTYLQALEKDSLDRSHISLEDVLAREVEQLLDASWWTIADTRSVKDYPTEKIVGSLALNVGYGGVLLSGKPDNFTYAAAPYVGLSFPLSKRASSAAILQHTSLSIGAFIENLAGPDDRTYTGPVFGRPYFAALGYRVFRFIRINAGVVALEEKLTDHANGSQQVNFDLNRIQLQPFVGLSAEISLSAGLGHK